MLKPPFKLASSAPGSTGVLSGIASTYAPVACCEEDATTDAAAPAARARLADLDSHLHCSVIGTCLSTAELRKLMARFLFVRDASDLEVHHEAVRLSGQGGPVVKALHKALDQRHEVAVQRFAGARDEKALSALWDEALRQGEIPGAYWAVLTHRGVTPELRQKVFGDVHMLSHLVGAANRADIRRLVALEAEIADLRERGERQQLRSHELAEEREQTIAQLRLALADSEAQRQAASTFGAQQQAMQSDRDQLASTLALVAVQTERRERAEQSAGVATAEAERLRDELEHLGRHVRALNRELFAAETQLREIGDGPAMPNRSLDQKLKGRRVFYVGGRPSSTPAIRDLVLRHGGEFQHHDGGLEDRKGLLASCVAWAELVVFPVDCIDHDSAGNLKKMCTRQGVAYVPLRGASVASFAAALSNAASDDEDDEGGSGRPGCLRHG